MKICKKCGIEKDFSEFYYEKKSKDGYRAMCKICISEYQKGRKEERKLYLEIYNEKNEDILKDKKRKYYQENKEKLKIYRAEYTEKNKEKINKKVKEYYENNKRKIDEYTLKYTKDRILNDPLFYLKYKIRRLINVSIRNKGYTKKSRTYQILGCSFDEFKIYIESKFEHWMNWTNHGAYNIEYNTTWQLDHIIPISLAESENDIIKLNHYTNFQPLCSRKNIEKSNKII
jgi:hypothetical protein